MSDRSAFLAAVGAPWFAGERVKDLRDRPIQRGGRAELSLFEVAGPSGRPHPRLRVSHPPVEDADPPQLPLLDAPPSDAEGFEGWLQTVVDAARDALDPEVPPGPSPAYRRLGLRGKRVATLIRAVEERLDGWLEEGVLPAAAADGCRYTIRRQEALLYAGDLRFDDEDSGTYHSYGKDAPFVHFLERLLDSLPPEDSQALSLLEGEQREAVRRQREQIRAHLDHLMRHKYAHDGVDEQDIERSVGGFLIDRETRLLVSEAAESAGEPQPRYVLLRIDPESPHPHAGAWLAREGDSLVLQQVFSDPPELEGDGRVELPADQLLELEVPAARLSFRRAPGDPRLRAGIRLDWDGGGFVAPEPIGWIAWAGHCDIKGIVEALGLALTGEPAPEVEEYRSDTDAIQRYDRDLLLEMLCAAMELGSSYVGLDGSGPMRRGVQRFGGARNDSLPDRLQLTGSREGQGLRWPLGRRQDEMVVRRIQVPRREGEPEDPDLPGFTSLDPSTVFRRRIPEEEGLGFTTNPRWLKVVDQDYGVIDVSGGRFEADCIEHGIHPETGAPVREPVRRVIDLRPEAPRRQVLGTALKDAGARTVWRVMLDLDLNQAIGTVLQFVRSPVSGRYEAEERPEQSVRLQLARPGPAGLEATLSREARLDAPQLLDQVLQRAVRYAEGICADTDWEAEVWNGVVTRLNLVREAEDRPRRLEAWRVEIEARFGRAVLRYRLRRRADGGPEAWCALAPRPGENPCDFLWQDHPDVASKGQIGRRWVVNRAMRERGLVQLRWSPTTPGGWYVHDEHIKNCYELLWCGLSGRRYTVVHNNKRYVFADRASWQAAVDGLRALRPAAERLA